MNRIKKLRLWILPIVLILVILIPNFLLFAADWSGLTARKSLGNSASYAWNTIGGTSNELILSSDATVAPDAPTNVAATSNLTDKVTVTWDASAGATGYHVWRNSTDLGDVGNVVTYDDASAGAPSISVNSSSVGQGTSTANVPLAVDATGVYGTLYTYYVVAYNGAGSSPSSVGDTGFRAIGVLGYQWYRSSGTGDSDFSVLAGATTANYNDATASAPTITAGASSATDGTYNVVQLSLVGTSANNGVAKYYYCSITATGATTVTTTHYSGYRGVGSLTYQWLRSLADSDANYITLTGATTATYEDSTPPNLAGRYYKCTLNATGATEETSTPDRGYLDTSKGSPAQGNSKALLFLLIPIELAAIIIIIMVLRMQMAGSVRAIVFTLALAVFLIVTFLIIMNFLNAIT